MNRRQFLKVAGARKRLQAILDQHPAAPYDKATDGKQRKKKSPAAKAE